MNPINILIVEDEFILAEDIASRLLAMGYHVAKIASGVEEALGHLHSIPIDIVLIDINLNGTKNGIDLAEAINKEFRLPFIFLTSVSDENTLKKAGKTSPAAYLLKPFNNNQVRIAIEMALYNFYEGQKPAIESIPEKNRTPDLPVKMPGALFLKKDTRYDKVEFSNILWLEADSNYTFIHTKTETYVYSNVLKNFEDKLPPDMFLRVHRSFIVNISCITGFTGNTLLIAKKQIPVNKATRDEVFKRFTIV